MDGTCTKLGPPVPKHMEEEGFDLLCQAFLHSSNSYLRVKHNEYRWGKTASKCAPLCPFEQFIVSRQQRYKAAKLLRDQGVV